MVVRIPAIPPGKSCIQLRQCYVFSVDVDSADQALVAVALVADCLGLFTSGDAGFAALIA